MNVEEQIDRIGELFKGSTIFITGATGFIGKALIEKLLRCTEVKKLYLLIRSKKGKSPNERLQDIFNNVIFKILLEQKPNIMTKCEVITGDVIETDLGINIEQRKILCNEIDFIFHSAASTRFDDTLRYAIMMNTRGTKYALDLAEECKHLKLFIHVSTAYIHPTEEVIFERPFDPPANPHEVLKSLTWAKEDKDIPTSLGAMPNSYTFSKNLAEALVHEKMGQLPCIIGRPAVVVPSFKDPFPGWFNNLQGPMGLFVGAGKGVIRSMYMDSRSYANLIPVDGTVSALLASSWYYLTSKGSQNIFNICVPQCDYKASWEEIITVATEVINERVPFNGILWYPSGTMTKNRLAHRINVTVFQIIPAIFIDLLLMLLGYKPILYNIQLRIIKGGEMFEFYTNKSWNFDTTGIEKIRQRLNKKESEIYLMRADKIDIKDYLEKCMLSCRRNILKETDDMLPAAKRNMKIMYVVDRLVKLIFIFFVGYYIYSWIMYPKK